MFKPFLFAQDFCTLSILALTGISLCALFVVKLQTTSYLVVPHSALSPEEKAQDELVIIICLYVTHDVKSSLCPVPLKGFTTDNIIAEDKMNRAVLRPFKGQSQ